MTYVLMKVLESAPSRYDLGIRLLTLGQVDRAYDRLVAHVKPGQQALDIGCGTGALTIRAAQAGAKVTGIDVSARMLEIARRRVERAGLGERVTLREQGIAELGGWADASYDVVFSGLCLSELTEGERALALGEVRRLVRPGGLLLVADEVRPRRVVTRVLNLLIRLPLVVLTYLLTQTTTHALQDLPGLVRAAGFDILSTHRNGLGGLMALMATAPKSEEADDGGNELLACELRGDAAADGAPAPPHRRD